MPRSDAEPVQPIALSWPGRRAPATVEPGVWRVSETFEPHDRAATSPSAETLPDDWNRLFLGDNLRWLTALVESDLRGQFRLIYVDPPYGSGVTWSRKVRLRGPTRVVGRRELLRQPEYGDTLDEADYLQSVADRLPLLEREVMSGEITAAAAARELLDLFSGKPL